MRLRAAAWFAGLLLGAPAGMAEPSPVHILVDAPLARETVRNLVHQAPIRGTALAAAVGSRAYDVMLVLDISGSTSQPSGVDVDRDGELGVSPHPELDPNLYPDTTKNTDPGDSILAAEVAAADALVARLQESAGVRVGILSFSGEMNPTTGHRVRFDQQDAWLEVPLTEDLAAVRARLPAILARGPYGAPR